jgi:hypothetical protein
MSAALSVRLLLWSWFAAAVAAGHFLLLQRVAPSLVPAGTAVLTALLLAGCSRLAPLRTWVEALDLRSLVLLHTTRLGGVYLIFLYLRHELPRSIAVSAALGGIVVALLALPVALAPLAPETRQRAIAIWNVVGSLQLALALYTGARLFVTAPAEMRTFTHLPLSLAPSFLVPLLVASHVILFVRLVRGSRPA